MSIVTARAGERPPTGPERGSDDVGDLLGLDQPLDRVRREDHVLQHALLVEVPCAFAWSSS